MAAVDGGTWMEHLSAQECWSLLTAATIGRVAVLVDSAPEIYPVNHVVDGESVVFRTNAGNKLHAVDRTPSVCFEVDGYDAETRGGWSVLVKGKAVELSSAAELQADTELPRRFWGSGDKSHWIRIVPYEITGRRIVAARKQES